MARQDNLGCYFESSTTERLAVQAECGCDEVGGFNACLDQFAKLDETPEQIAFKEACHDSGCGAEIDCEGVLYRGFTPEGYEAMTACFEEGPSESCRNLRICINVFQLGCAGPQEQ